MSAFLGPDLPALVFELLVKSILLLAVVLSLTWFMRRSSAAVRHHYFTVASVSMIVLPLAAVLLPSWHTDVIPDRVGYAFAPSVALSPKPGAGTASPAQPIDASAELKRHADTRTGLTADVSWRRWVFIIWLSGAAILLLGLVAGKVFGFLTARQARPVIDNDFLSAVEKVARQAGLNRQLVVLKSDRIKVPCVSGILRPKLLIPPQAVFWPQDRLEAVLHHELSHIKRNDLLAQFCAQVACCLYWPNPLVWITERMLFIERERACDDLALGQDVKASDYAGHLMEVLEEMGDARNNIWVTAAMAEGTDFKDRILSVLNPAAKRTAPRRGHLAATVVLAALVVLPFSALRPCASEATDGGQDHESTTAGTSHSRKLDRSGNDASRQAHVHDANTTRGLPIRLLIDQLESPSAYLRERAAVALGESGDKRAVQPLISVLDDNEAGVREHVSMALGKLEDTRAVPYLIATLDDENVVVREHAATALGMLKDNRAVGKLCDVLRNDPSPVVREHAATALGHIGDRRAYRPLTQALESDSNPAVREHAFRSIQQLESDR